MFLLLTPSMALIYPFWIVIIGLRWPHAFRRTGNAMSPPNPDAMDDPQLAAAAFAELLKSGCHAQDSRQCQSHASAAIE